MFLDELFFLRGRIDFQNVEDDDKTDEDEDVDDNEEDKDESEDEEDEDDEEEDKDEDDKDDEDEDDKDDDKELVRADYKVLKKEFPDLFKKHPEFKEAIFAEQAFREIFSTVEEAKEASDVVEAYEEVRESVVTGNVEKFFEHLEEADAKGMKKFAANFMPALEKANKNLFLEISLPVVDKFIRNVYAHGKSLEKQQDRDNVIAAAKIVRKLLIGGDYNDIEREPSSKDSIIKREESDEERELARERAKLAEEKYGRLFISVRDSAYSLLDKKIMEGLDGMSKGQQKLAAKLIRDAVLEEMDKDEIYTGKIKRLWQKEGRAGYSGNQKSSIIATFLGKARNIIPKHRAAVRKDLGIKKAKSDEKDETPRISGGKRGKEDTGTLTPEKAKGKTTREIFDS